MWKSYFFKNKLSASFAYHTNDYKALYRYIENLASTKMGYPVSLLTHTGHINNSKLGIQQHSLANVLLNNVGDPFKDSETSLMEVKKHEREVITLLSQYYGMPEKEMRGYVTTGGTEGNFAALWWSKRYVVSQCVDELSKVDSEYKLMMKAVQELQNALQKIPLDEYRDRNTHLEEIVRLKTLIDEKKGLIQQIRTPTVFYTKNHTHYSVPKISEILHLNIRPVAANEDGSINIDNFRKELLLHKEAHPLSAVIVVANIGTTVTGAIDDVLAMKHALDDAKLLQPYTIHMDGALTGFVLPILKPFGEIPNYFKFLGVNTLAFSAHKFPGLSTPCGVILTTKTFLDKAFEKSERNIEYVGNIVDITISGSRSGLNVLMFHHAICTLGLDKGLDALRLLVKQNMETAQYLYDHLCRIFGSDKVKYPHHFNVSFPRPSAEMARKYQLMLVGETATVCVLSNVTKDLVDRFLVDLKKDLMIHPMKLAVS